MGYVAVKGGSQAIEEASKRMKYERLKAGIVADVSSIAGGLRGLVDVVMSESSLYSRELAAVAIKQAEGSVEEAVFLMRAYRSTLPRKYYSQVIDTDNMFVQRRISSCFKDVPGGQILGAATDYSHRLIDFSLLEETTEEASAWLKDFQQVCAAASDKEVNLSALPKVTNYLRKEGLIAAPKEDNTEPIDITKKNIEFPTKRCERLQIMTRGQTGGVISLGYAALRGYGDLHPTVGELRVGFVDILVADPFDGSELYIGKIQLTEVETYVASTVKDDDGNSRLQFEIGYGVCYGQNESKAIAMSLLDRCLEVSEKQYPTQDEEFVLYHIDSVESTGFISHLKLPHYVTFKSKLDSIRKTQKKKAGQQNHENGI